MKQHYDLLLIGATALAAGIADRFVNQTIAVIESGCLAAPEFSAAMKTDGKAFGAPDSILKREAIRRKALTETSEWLPAVSPLTADRFSRRGADLYFFSAVTDIRGADGGFAVTFSCYGVKNSFFCTRIIDTTSRFVTRAFFGQREPKLSASFNYLTEDLALHSMPCEDDIGAARLELLEKREGRILTAASELALTPEEHGRVLGGNAGWFPSAFFGNAFEAYAEGLSTDLWKADGAETVEPSPVYDGSFDVIVAGLGTAGAVAAFAAAKEGLSVLGLESLSMMGGSASAGSVIGYYYGYKGGLYRKLDEEARDMNRDSYCSPGGLSDWVGVSQKATMLDHSLKAAGAVCRYGASVTDVLKTGNRVNGVKWFENGVPHIARAKFVIDCTAEASVCVAADCRMIGGRKSDNRLQPFSSVFMSSWVRKDGQRLMGYGYHDDGCVWQYDADAFGAAVLRAAVTRLHLRGDYSDRSYLGIAPLIGLREGLKILGEETIDFETMIAGDFCKEPVYYGLSNLDNHGKDSALEDRIYQDWITICDLWGWNTAIPVPMGALIPKGVDGLLAGGRNVSVDHNLAMGLRMKDDASKSGEAAAELAFLAIRDGVPAKDVSRGELRARLTETGCLKKEDRVKLDVQKANEVHEFPLWCADDGKLTEGFASDRPGYFMWSARTLKKTALCHSLLRSENDNVRFCAALTLAMLDDGSDETVDTLIECAQTRDGYIPNTSWMYNNLRSVSAICALGRLGTEKAVPVLLGMLADDSFIEALPYRPLDFFPERKDVYFQYRTNCIAALCEIAARHPARAQEIRAFLLPYGNEHTFEVSMMSTKGFGLDCTATIRRMIGEI